jgi:hypothetical protein
MQSRSARLYPIPTGSARIHKDLRTLKDLIVSRFAVEAPDFVERIVGSWRGSPRFSRSAHWAFQTELRFSTISTQN